MVTEMEYGYYVFFRGEHKYFTDDEEHAMNEYVSDLIIKEKLTKDDSLPMIFSGKPLKIEIKRYEVITEVDVW